MANHGSREGNRQERRSSSSSGSGLGLLEASSSLFDGLSSFQDLCVETGRSALWQLMEKERELRCGAKGRHQDARSVWRAGSARRWSRFVGQFRSEAKVWFMGM